ncbi:hypothetical protein O4J56_31140 [Nocardiopsis sp. RSe5-2]|uniref:Secreted protein n=1 Tax=Nocardiopsis endophytica TaxID=3018445 RepID=A0ABT4UDZ0_9ACTN|nr:hypothetical protein [Nocardiopsis endophytica]MDA2815138.1 hypothetical protein [Nocardiopsis endophytica]
MPVTMATALRRTTIACGSAAAALALTAGLAAPAHADHEDTPTSRQLLELCNNGTDVCVFHPEGPVREHQAARHVVGSPVYNCTDREQWMTVGWSDTTSESNSVGLSLGGGYKFGEVFQVSFEATYGHEWKNSHTESQTTTVIAAPGEVGRVYVGPRMQTVNGTYELHFPDRYYGHYYWYVPFEATGPTADQSGTITQSTRPMTSEERAAHC